jgi:phosphoribosylformylglycinamidine (FGAM) synthase-like amidotransferase family enzyme
MQAAVDRIRFLPRINVVLFVRFIYLDALLIPLFIYDLLTVRRIHKITIIGVVCILFLQFAVTMAWGSPAWNKLAYNLFAPFMEQQVEIKLTDAQTDPVLGYYGDKKWKMAVIRTGGKVYLQLPDVPKLEMAAISETEWFLKATTWRISFIKSPDGSITKIINKQPNVTWEKPRFKQQ